MDYATDSVMVGDGYIYDRNSGKDCSRWAGNKPGKWLIRSYFHRIRESFAVVDSFGNLVMVEA